MELDIEKQQRQLCSETVFRSVFDSHFKLLRNFLAFRFKDIERAEDTAQNAFVKLWENCGKIHPEQAKSFLFTTALRLSLNLVKHDKVVLNFQIRSNVSEVHHESPDFILEEDEIRRDLEKAINELPEKQRTVFLMNRIEKQSYTEIAKILEISVKTVEKRMHLALLSLRKVVQNV